MTGNGNKKKKEMGREKWKRWRQRKMIEAGKAVPAKVSDPPEPKPKKVLYCQPCGLEMHDESGFQNHLNGRHHKRRLANLGDEDSRTVKPFKIFVTCDGGMPKEKDFIESYFKQFGTISTIRESHKTNFRYAVVVFSDHEAVDKALSQCSHKHRGKELIVRQFFTRRPMIDLKKEANVNNKNRRSLFRKMSRATDPPNQLEILAQTMGMSQEEADQRLDICRDLNNIISPYFEYCRIKAFGSSINGFGMKGCDLDIFVDLDGKSDGTEKTPFKFPFKPRALNFTSNTAPIPATVLKEKTDVEVMRLLGMILRSSRRSEDEPALIPAPRCPYLMFNYMTSGLKCDMSINNKLAAQNSSLLRLYSQDIRVRQVVLAVRFWAKTHGLASVSCQTHLISSYALTWLVLYFLMRRKPQVVPHVLDLTTLLEKQGVVEETILKHRTVFVPEHAKLPPSENKETAMELLRGFFQYYNTEVDWTQVILSTWVAVPLSPEMLGNYKMSAMNLLDPFVLTHNILASAHEKLRAKFKDKIKEACEILESLTDGPGPAITEEGSIATTNKPMAAKEESSPTEAGSSSTEDKSGPAADEPMVTEVKSEAATTEPMVTGESAVTKDESKAATEPMTTEADSGAAPKEPAAKEDDSDSETEEESASSINYWGLTALFKTPEWEKYPQPKKRPGVWPKDKTPRMNCHLLPTRAALDELVDRAREQNTTPYLLWCFLAERMVINVLETVYLAQMKQQTEEEGVKFWNTGRLATTPGLLDEFSKVGSYPVTGDLGPEEKEDEMEQNGEKEAVDGTTSTACDKDVEADVKEEEAEAGSEPNMGQADDCEEMMKSNKREACKRPGETSKEIASKRSKQETSHVDVDKGDNLTDKPVDGDDEDDNMVEEMDGVESTEPVTQKPFGEEGYVKGFFRVDNLEYYHCWFRDVEWSNRTRVRRRLVNTKRSPPGIVTERLSTITMLRSQALLGLVEEEDEETEPPKHEGAKTVEIGEKMEPKLENESSQASVVKLKSKQESESNQASNVKLESNQESVASSSVTNQKLGDEETPTPDDGSQSNKNIKEEETNALPLVPFYIRIFRRLYQRTRAPMVVVEMQGHSEHFKSYISLSNNFRRTLKLMVDGHLQEAEN